MPRLTRDDEAALAALVERYGAAVVLEHCSAIPRGRGRPPKQDVPANRSVLAARDISKLSALKENYTTAVLAAAMPAARKRNEGRQPLKFRKLDYEAIADNVDELIDVYQLQNHSSPVEAALNEWAAIEGMKRETAERYYREGQKRRRGLYESAAAQFVARVDFHERLDAPDPRQRAIEDVALAVGATRGIVERWINRAAKVKK